ncbi:MAG: hypothetical protein DMG84_11820 [Acidobacteria bacterium]|nr:MAG: hypothetical protein DMG84_11820 [Acidobacteriota bacterium]
MKRVTIFQAVVKQYNAPFFEQLHAALCKDDVELQVVYSAPNAVEIRRSDCVDLPIEYGRRVPALWFLNRRLILQRAWEYIANSDLLIIEQANKYLWNHPLLAASRLRLRQVAFWGHGANRQERRPVVSEWYKRKTLNAVDWWFAYTGGTVQYLVQHGVPADKITNVQNAVDTRSLRGASIRVSRNDCYEFRRRLGIDHTAPVGAYCGMLEPAKLGFIFEILSHIKASLPEFHYIIAGAGTAERQVEDFASRNAWVHWVGPKFGDEKALFLNAADAVLMAGPLGLVILDAFAAGLPVFTLDIPSHGPEIEYLEDDVNGLLTPPNAIACSRAVVETLGTAERLQRLKKGAWQSGGQYTLEAMVDNFRAGIVQCLAREHGYVEQ